LNPILPAPEAESYQIFIVIAVNVGRKLAGYRSRGLRKKEEKIMKKG